MRTPPLLLFSSALLTLTPGCKEDKKAGGGGACLTVIDCDAGFDCIGGLCMPAGVTSVGTTESGTTGTSAGTTSTSDGTTSATDGKGDETGGDPCPVNGVLYCPCDNGSCEPGLLCTGTDICIVDPCPPGTEGCVCDDGACPAPLDCVNGFCVDQSGGECIQPYNSCFDNAMGSLGDCCTGTTCIGYEPDNAWGCATTCVAHSECATDCCVNVEGAEETYCSPTASFCNEQGKCIDTCFDANDGYCDDGGPGSVTSWCELGTDCADCGVR